MLREFFVKVSKITVKAISEITGKLVLTYEQTINTKVLLVYMGHVYQLKQVFHTCYPFIECFFWQQYTFNSLAL